jgi:hypothetical protein
MLEAFDSRKIMSVKANIDLNYKPRFRPYRTVNAVQSLKAVKGNNHSLFRELLIIHKSTLTAARIL